MSSQSLPLYTKNQLLMTPLKRYNVERLDSEDDTPMLNTSPSSAPRSRINYDEEPITHIQNQNQSLLLRLLIGCWPDKKNRLTRSELWSFSSVREEANKTFDVKTEDFNNLFRELYRLFTQESLEEIPNENWKEFGFQNSNPRSDFRAGGLLALNQLISFARSYSKRIKFMIVPSNDFLLAVASINITHFLAKYYHLVNPTPNGARHQHKELCSRTALKVFCQLLEENSEILDQIHHMLLNDLYDTWQTIRKTVPGVTLLDFGMAQEVVKKKFISATKNKHCTSFDNLNSAYEKSRVPIPNKRPSMMGQSS